MEGTLCSSPDKGRPGGVSSDDPEDTQDKILQAVSYTHLDVYKRQIVLIRKAAQAPDINATTGRGLVEIVSRYTQTFLWLQRYDEGLLNDPQGQTGGDLPTPEIAMQALQQLKQVLVARGEATALFAHPREDGLSAIFGNQMCIRDSLWCYSSR